ncbi:MAG: phycobilisome protein [Alkalinema sp. RU_4_3]|nr:phycobilisome protein [Alkalinema sp. RU_4_3]
MALSEHLKQLIQKARIMDFQDWSDRHSPEIVALFQAADEGKLYLTDDALTKLKHLYPDRGEDLAIVQMLRDQVVEIVDEARAGVLARFPTILEPGGGLYPPERADACWRDFWQFLRCITYGIAGQQTQYTSESGLQHMRLLYEELQVPLDAMVVGLEGIKLASLKRVSPEQQSDLVPYFDHLTQQLDRFRKM